MDPRDETRTLRRRLAELEDQLAHSNESARVGCITVVGKTTHVGTYPTSAQRWYAINAVRISGVIAEGTAPTLTDGSSIFYSLNIGSAIPPEGTYVVTSSTSGRFTFIYNG